MNLPELGFIEGYYGRPWTTKDRVQAISALAVDGYRFYLYAPKADQFLGNRWQQPHPLADAEALQAFASYCRSKGVRFGMGLSPRQLDINFDNNGKQHFKQKLQWLDELGIQDLAILFDDEKTEAPEISVCQRLQNQIAITHFAAENSAATRVLYCPGYYADDPLLDRLFGKRPQRYLETLGKELDQSIEIFWAGPEVCSKALPPVHLARIGEQLQRPPVLWDNYPVNDGPIMSQHLHLKGFTGRPASNASLIKAHGINVASQPVLTQIPALTLIASYLQGDDYCYMTAFKEASTRVLGKNFAQDLAEDLFLLQDKGLDRLSPEEIAALHIRYVDINHPAADEICRWLNGDFYCSGQDMGMV